MRHTLNKKSTPNLIKYFFIILSIFFLSSCANGNKSDPFEGYNRFMYKTNKTIDKYTIKPIAKGYKKITPKIVQTGIHNFYNNILEINVLANHLLQGKFHDAGISGSRLAWNSVVGLGGIIDVATLMGLTTERESFSQTLRYWGIPAGPYIVLPILGPSTPTDTVGLAGDIFISPFSYTGWGSETATYIVDGISIVDYRSRFLESEKQLEDLESSIDEYSFVRNIYLQKMESDARDGEPVDTEIDDEFDKIFDENQL